MLTDSVCDCDTHAMIGIYCHPRISNCLDQTAQYLCGTCKLNYYLNTENTCSKCVDNCDRCPDVSKCDTCKTGYFLYKGTTCTLCTSKGFVKDDFSKICYDCPDNWDECCTPFSSTKCSSRYYLYGVEDPVSCLPCLSGFIRLGLNDGTGTCAKCAVNCLECTNCTVTILISFHIFFLISFKFFLKNIIFFTGRE